MAVPVSAQRIISGTVFDENKEPLTGATVSVKEKVTLGTTTGTQGTSFKSFGVRVPVTTTVSIFTASSFSIKSTLPVLLTDTL